MFDGMTSTLTEKPCIEIQFLTDACEQVSVAEYEEAQRRAERLSPRARSFWDVNWAVEALPVEKLTTQWQKPGAESFRISDPAGSSEAS